MLLRQTDLADAGRVTRAVAVVDAALDAGSDGAPIAHEVKVTGPPVEFAEGAAPPPKPLALFAHAHRRKVRKGVAQGRGAYLVAGGAVVLADARRYFLPAGAEGLGARQRVAVAVAGEWGGAAGTDADVTVAGAAFAAVLGAGAVVASPRNVALLTRIGTTDVVFMIKSLNRLRLKIRIKHY